jgi:hypothetical protein
MNPEQQHPPQPSHSPQHQDRQQRYYGTPHPGSQGTPPQKKSTLGWILGGIALAVTLLCVLGFMGCSALAQEINGDGGSQEEKASDMKARADNVPEDDWIELFRHDPKVDPDCVSTNTSCLRMTARWSVAHKVSLEEAATRFGMKSSQDGPALGRYVGCVKTEVDGVNEDSLCIEESPGSPDSYEITIQMQRD